MICPGCEHKKTFTIEEVEALVKEQLLLEPDHVSESLLNQRLTICQDCSLLVQHTCLKCGCFIKFRASLPSKQCPIKKW